VTPERLCPYCGHIKTADKFPRSRRRCTACEVARVNAWKDANRDRAMETHRQHGRRSYRRDPPKHRIAWALYYLRHGEELRARRRAAYWAKKGGESVR